MKVLCAISCYSGDANLVRAAMPLHLAHGFPVIVLSPLDSQSGDMGGVVCRHAGKRAYIGQDSIDRQIAYMKILLEHDAEWFLFGDADSFCVSARLPDELFEDPDVMWANIVTEPRPHETPGYPKLAFQPDYFFSRVALERMLAVGPVTAHPVTPYCDWLMVKLCVDAGLKHRPFTELEHPAELAFTGTDPWEQLDFRIRRMGTCFCHPIKTAEQLNLCVEARKWYELVSV